MQFFVNFDLYNNTAYDNLEVEKNVTSNQPILKRGQKYCVNVVRATIPTLDIPICNLSDIKDLEIGVMTKATGVVSASVKLSDVWQAQNTLNNGNVYSISHLIRVLNRAIDNARPNSFKFKIVGDSFAIDAETAVVSDYSLVGNSLFYNLFASGFSTVYDPARALAYEIALSYHHRKEGATTFIQESSTIPNCYMYDTLIIQSDLPQVPEQTGSFGTDATSQMNSISMLTDIALSGDLKNSAYFIPQIERNIYLIQSDDVISVKISVWIRNKKGILKRLTIPPGSHFSLKLCIREL